MGGTTVSSLSRREFIGAMGIAAALASVESDRRARAASLAAPRSRTYHIDPVKGDDGNDGLTPSRPLKTYAGRELAAGDTVLFKRGSVIRDMLYTRNGREGAPIVYGAYGEGAKPAFLGSAAIGDPGQWAKQRPSLWRYTEPVPSEVCNLVFNGGRSCGILRWRIEDLQRPGEWHYTGLGTQRGGGDLYLCSPTNPGLAYTDIECVLWGQRRLVGGQSHIVLENLSFRNSGVHGYQESGTRQIVIRNCEFRFIGGAVWDLNRRIRFGNAVEFWDGAHDIRVEGCRFDNIYDSGVTHQGGGTRNIPERLWFGNNLFVDCGLTAYECREPCREVFFEHNTCINAGGGFSMQGDTPPRPSDPYPQPVGYHVWAWLIDPGTQPGKVYVRHNIFYGGHGPAICLSIDPADDHKFVFDHNSYWQTTGQPVIHLGKGVKNWAEAMTAFQTTGKAIDWGARRSYLLSEFGHYQAESGQDGSSRVAKPLFVDEASGDFRQRGESPCLGMGMEAGGESGDGYLNAKKEIS
ncbi:MAG: right-handed parallel beta-helix repeat-containing protein [Phycisphaerae bacterium]|nr:right-handed parallel beta-helix repeat-containing protein [Phycisphaerae bacterium]